MPTETEHSGEIGPPRPTPLEMFLNSAEEFRGTLVACPCGWFAVGHRHTVKALHNDHEATHSGREAR